MVQQSSTVYYKSEWIQIGPVVVKLAKLRGRDRYVIDVFVKNNSLDACLKNDEFVEIIKLLYNLFEAGDL